MKRGKSFRKVVERVCSVRLGRVKKRINVERSFRAKYHHHPAQASQRPPELARKTEGTPAFLPPGEGSRGTRTSVRGAALTTTN